MKTMGRRTAWVLVIVLTVALGATAVATLYWKSTAAAYAMSGGQLWQTLSWRVQLFARKAEGGIPELSWTELWRMSRQPGGFSLALVFRNAESLDASVQNPYITDEDHQVGARLYNERCAACHGSEGKGWHAPPLNRAGLKFGDSDLSIYKVLRDGIAGTPMAAADVSWLERWQIVGYLRRLQIHGAAEREDAANSMSIDVTSEQILAAGSRPDEWLTYSGSLDGRRYSTANEITPANVSRLRVRWVWQSDSNDAVIEATPLVVHGAIFTTDPPSSVVALDARTGNVIWRYKRTISADLPLCCGRVNRGLAILGNLLFFGSLDGYLVAINANTGKMIWQTRVADPAEGYTMTGSPLIANRSVVVGVAGGEYGIRGFLAAYDAGSGQQQWKFFTIPGPGAPGHETWKSDAWRSGGGATWVTGSYDPSLDLIYWGVGNPSPPFFGDVRPGDNLFTNSVIAVHASSGQLAWHFQFTPHDEHDWDASQTPILTDVMINGTSRRVICWLNRNGFYYVLDRTTGEFLVGKPFVELNWAKGLDAAGRPIPEDAASTLSIAGRLTRPGVAGGTNWENPAFDQERGLIFVPAMEGASVFTRSASPNRGDRGIYVGSAGSTSEPPTHVVRALDAGTGTMKWEHVFPRSKAFPNARGGLLATAGGLIFGATGGSAFALESASGDELWRVFLGGQTRAPPISFTVDRRQFIAIAAGRALFVFGL